MGLGTHSEIVLLPNNKCSIYHTWDKVPHCAVKCKQSLLPLLHSVHSINNIINSLTCLFVAYFDMVVVYVYFTNQNGKCYGSRMFEQDLFDILPKIFENTQVDGTACNDGCAHKITEDEMFKRNKAALFECKSKKESDSKIETHEESDDNL